MRIILNEDSRPHSQLLRLFLSQDAITFGKLKNRKHAQSPSWHMLHAAIIIKIWGGARVALSPPHAKPARIKHRVDSDRRFDDQASGGDRRGRNRASCKAKLGLYLGHRYVSIGKRDGTSQGQAHQIAERKHPFRDAISSRTKPRRRRGQCGAIVSDWKNSPSFLSQKICV